ncbi:hypothetical protein QTH89_26925 [Variovorax sp. J22G21]|uniref:hypothetical protein n=1 Tax=Variovorax fucosicus TaxID=3053517 RepID=UPI002578738F|nr:MULTISPECIES: hypothetical protein [unclassified Variovorax]MDM0042816.1 hypothetical protein [Variovorax sp. J22R193]MDM0064873.1 hypothetical protein [Variovorax sp. J22G21]
MGSQIWHTCSADGKTMSEEDVAHTFAAAASDSRRLGFDTVEIHGVHGQLVDRPYYSQHRCGSRKFTELDGENGLNLAGWAKKVTGAPAISADAVGLNNEFFGTYNGERFEATSLDQLINRMDREEFDLIAIGGALTSDFHGAENVRMKNCDPAEIGAPGSA